MASPSFEESLRARMQEFDFTSRRNDYGKYLFNIFEKANTALVETKQVNLRPDRTIPLLVHHMAFKPLNVNGGQITIRTRFAPVTYNLDDHSLQKHIELVQFEGQYNDTLSGVADRVLATVDSSCVPKTPLGEVRDDDTLDQLKLITNQVMLFAGMPARSEI